MFTDVLAAVFLADLDVLRVALVLRDADRAEVTFASLIPNGQR